MLRRIVVSGVTLGTMALFGACGGGDSPTEPSDSEPGPAPTVSSVEPAEGTVGTEVKITGTDFRSGASVQFDGLSSDSVDVVSGTEIFALAPSGIDAGVTYTVTVVNDDGTQGDLADAFAGVGPTLLFVNGATKPSGQVGSTVVFDGDAFGDLHTASDGTVLGRVLFSDGAGGTVEATIANEEDWVNTFILTRVPDGAATGDVVVETQTGTSDPIEFTVTSEATFSPSIVVWNKASHDLPKGLSGHEALFLSVDDGSGGVDQYVHVLGGASNDSMPVSEVHFAPIQTGGDIGAWTQTASMSTPRAFHAAVAATPFNSRVKTGDGFVYALGGIEAKGGDPVASVLRAPIQSDGSLGSWEDAGFLPEGLHSLEAEIFRSVLYVSAGARTGNEPVETVYKAPIDSLGVLGSWEQLASLPNAHGHHEMTVIGNCIHVFGGDSTAVDPDDATITDTRIISIFRNRIDLRTGDLTSSSWMTDDTDATKARAKHTSLISGGVVLQSAGLYDGIGTFGSSEQQFAQIGDEADACDVQDFNGANNDNSIGNQTDGANLFNHAAISFLDTDGNLHVMILGGDDVDAPGEKRPQVWFF